MTKTQILTFTKPSQLFSIENYKDEYRKYAKANHPDKGGDAKIMAHINKLYDMACALDRVHSWRALGFITVNGVDYSYNSVNLFELGHIYTSDTKLIYHIFSKFTTELNQITQFNNDKMKAQKIIPDKIDIVKDKTSGDFYYIVDIPEGSVLLRDILTKINIIEVKHIAWIISRLFNVCSLVQYNGLVHLDISPNTILINPKTHWAGLYGGWWYCYKEGDKISKIPASTYRILPYSSISTKEASYMLMNSQIRALGRELLGNRYGDNLSLKSTESKFIEYLTQAGGDNVIDDFVQWDTKIIDSIFGARKFAKWEIKKEDVYA
jgi:serine/threonine protein kinase